MRRSQSSINSTDASSECVDEAAYAVSRRTNLLLCGMDKVLNSGEQQLQQLVSRFVTKPLGRRTKKEKVKGDGQIGDTIVDEWRQFVQSDINDILAEAEIKRLLYTLDELQAREDQSNPNKEAWRPSGHPKADMGDFFRLRASDYRDKLKTAVEDLEKSVASKRRDLESGREHVITGDREVNELGKQLKKELKVMKGKSDEKPKMMSNDQLSTFQEKAKAVLNQ